LTSRQDRSEHIDLDVSQILTGEMLLAQAGDRLLDLMVKVCNGRLVAAEPLGRPEFVLTKLYASA